MSRFYLTTTAERAQEFLDHRAKARSAKPSGGAAALGASSVILTDRPVDSRYGVAGEIIFEIDLKRGESLGRYERKDPRKPYREWCLPTPLFLRLLKRMHII